MIPLGRQPAMTAEQIRSKAFGCNPLENSEERVATGTTFGCCKCSSHIISNANAHSTMIVFISWQVFGYAKQSSRFAQMHRFRVFERHWVHRFPTNAGQS